jgi:hypothetical protein
MYFATVVWPTSMTSLRLRSSPWMRGAPHSFDLIALSFAHTGVAKPKVSSSQAVVFDEGAGGDRIAAG